MDLERKKPFAGVPWIKCTCAKIHEPAIVGSKFFVQNHFNRHFTQFSSCARASFKEKKIPIVRVIHFGPVKFDLFFSNRETMGRSHNEIIRWKPYKNSNKNNIMFIINFYQFYRDNSFHVVPFLEFSLPSQLVSTTVNFGCNIKYTI